MKKFLFFTFISVYTLLAAEQNPNTQSYVSVVREPVVSRGALSKSICIRFNYGNLVCQFVLYGFPKTREAFYESLIILPFSHS